MRRDSGVTAYGRTRFGESAMSFTPATLRFFKQLATHNNKEWFEAHRDSYEHDVRERRKTLDRAVWVPLRSIDGTAKTGRYGYLGYSEDFLGVGTLAVPLDQRTAAEKL